MAENTSDVSTESNLSAVKLKRRQHARKILSDDEASNGDYRAVVTNMVKHKSFPMPPKQKNKNNIQQCIQKNSASTSASALTKKSDKQLKNTETEQVVENILTFDNNMGKMVLHDSCTNTNITKRSSESESEMSSQIMQLIQESEKENIDVSSHIYTRSKQNTASEKHCNICKST